MKGRIKVALRMLKSHVAITACILLFLTSCKAQDLNSTANSVTMHLLLQDNYGGSVDEQLLVIKDQKSLNEYFGIFNRTRKPGIPVPEVDFAKDMVIIWSPGENKKDSYLKIKTSDTKKLVLKKVNVKLTNNISAITRPVHMYKLPNEAKSIQVQ